MSELPTLSAESVPVVRTTLDDAARSALLSGAPAPAHDEHTSARSPLHVVYGGADRFADATFGKLGALAQSAFATYAKSPADLAQALGWDDDAITARVHERVRAKLTDAPIEDFRVDFEDGFGVRPHDEEDHHAVRAGAALGAMAAADDADQMPMTGVRVRALDNASGERGLRTLDLFLTALVDASGGKLPQDFCVTIPKVQQLSEVTACVRTLDALEAKLGIEPGHVLMELMVETPPALVAGDGTPKVPAGACPLPAFVEACNTRCIALHFGAYDFLSACGVSAGVQMLHHPLNDHARTVMQLVGMQLGVRVSDGATNTMPIGPHKMPKDGELSDQQLAENRAVVHAAWRIHGDNVARSTSMGIWQGWDLHPAQFTPRYAAVYRAIEQEIEPNAKRLRNFLQQTARATRVGSAFDDAATAQGLVVFFVRALASGGIDEARVEQLLGITAGQLRTRSFDAMTS